MKAEFTYVPPVIFIHHTSSNVYVVLPGQTRPDKRLSTNLELRFPVSPIQNRDLRLIGGTEF